MRPLLRRRPAGSTILFNVAVAVAVHAQVNALAHAQVNVRRRGLDRNKVPGSLGGRFDLDGVAHVTEALDQTPFHPSGSPSPTEGVRGDPQLVTS
jgi:hypothetical protein